MIFLFKLIVCPVLLAIATIAARRWGQIVGGLIIGLPLISGPISVFLAIENGADFAVAAVDGSFVGTISLAFFSLAYARLCRFGITASVFAGMLVFGSVSAAVSACHPTTEILAVTSVAALCLCSFLMPKEKAENSVKLSKYDIPLRMAVMAVLMVVVTFLAPLIGPHATGIAAAFPYMALTMAVFAQWKGTYQHAQQVMYGLVNGLGSGCAFYMVVSCTLKDDNFLAAYSLAAAVSILVQFVIMMLIRRTKA